MPSSSTSGKLKCRVAACCLCFLAWWELEPRCIRRASPSSRRYFSRSERLTPNYSECKNRLCFSCTPFSLRQIKQQHFGVLYAGQLHGFFGGDRRAVAFRQILAIELDAAARHLHVSVALRLERMLHRFTRAQHRGVQLVFLANFHRAFPAVRRSDQAQLPALLCLREILLVVGGLQSLLFRKHPDLVQVHRLRRR